MRSYTTKQGDTWDGIAYSEYGDEMQMHLLIENNPQYADVVIFSAGTVLTIPEQVSELGRAPAPPWVTNG